MFSLPIGTYVEGTDPAYAESWTCADNILFSTFDNDTDGRSRNCAADRKGGFWMGSCVFLNMNGLLVGPGLTFHETHVHWEHFKSDTALMGISMAIK